MNTVEKFLKLSKNIYNAQDVLKNHFLSKNPILYTTKLTDYSQVTPYNGISEYVWMVHPDIELERTFPLWMHVSRDEPYTAYEFPYVYYDTNNVRTWGLVKLVPSHGVVETTIRKRIICGRFDPYSGKDKFDIFFIGDKESPEYSKLSAKHGNVVAVDSISDAFLKTTTGMFWIVPNTVTVNDQFDFKFRPVERAYDYPHVFGNGDFDTYNGVVLMPKTYDPSKKELEYNFYAKKRIIRTVASIPV